MTITLSANIEWLYSEVTDDPAERVRLAAADGLTAIEFHMWREKDLVALKAALDETGVRATGMLMEPRVNLCDRSPENIAGLRETYLATAQAAKELGITAVVGGGAKMAGMTRPSHRAAIIANLRDLLPLVEENGVGILLEAVNTIDHPASYMDNFSEVLDIVEVVDSPSVRMLYDFYHSAMMGVDDRAVITGRQHLISYLQIADAAGRAEPGTGDIDWAALRSLIADIGYDGVLGLELHPSGSTSDAVVASRAALGL